MKAAEFDQVLAIRLHRLGRDACLVHDVLVAAMAGFTAAQELTFYMLTTPCADPRTLTDEDTIEFGVNLFFGAMLAIPAIAVLVLTILK